MRNALRAGRSFNPVRLYRIHLWAIISLLLLAGGACAQATEDSLRRVLAQPGISFDQRHDATVRLGLAVFFNKGWDEGMEIYRQSLALGARSSDGQYRARSYGVIALAQCMMNDTAAAYKSLDSAFHYITRSRSNKVRAYLFYCKGWLESRTHKELLAIRSFQQALDLYENEPEADHNRYQELIYGELAGVYFHWKDLVNIEKYSRLSYNAALKLNDINRVINASQGMGSFFMNIFVADTTNKPALDSAFIYLRGALQIAQANRTRLATPSDIPFAAISISHIFLEFFPETPAILDSIHHYNKIALEEGKRTKQYSVEGGVYFSLAEMALSRKNYDDAIYYLNATITTALKDVLFDKVNLSEAHKALAEVYEITNNTSAALGSYKEYMRLYKELFDAQKMNNAKELEAKYEIAKKGKVLLEIRYLAELKDKELIQTRLESGQKDQDLLEARYEASVKDKALLAAKYDTELKEKALTAARYKTARNEQELKTLGERVQYNRKMNKIWSALVIALFLAAAFLYYAYKQRSKTLAQEKQLHFFEMDRIKQEHRISLLSAMLEGQEQERTRLARDLHDGLGGLLSGVKIELSGLTALTTAPPQQAIVGKTLQHLDHAVDELRRIAKSMMPEVLLSYGLGEATREYCSGLKKSGVPVTCQVFNYKNNMEASRQVTLYRIMQELVNNAIKHAAAAHILVQLQQSENRIFLTVEDDGRGIGKEQLQKLKGAGLANIQARIEMLQGKMDIASESGTGTTFTVECGIY